MFKFSQFHSHVMEGGHDWNTASDQRESSVRPCGAVSCPKGGSIFPQERGIFGRICLLRELEPGSPNKRVNHLVLLAARWV